MSKGRTHCSHGHLLDAANTIMTKEKHWNRTYFVKRCRTCKALKEERAKRRKPRDDKSLSYYFAKKIMPATTQEAYENPLKGIDQHVREYMTWPPGNYFDDKTGEIND